jgi:maltooligosyltrehalose trehalohydrolase
MGWDPDEVLDPQDPETFRRSKLDWDELSRGRHAVVLECYRRLGRLRRELPQLTDPAFGSVSCTVEDRLFTMRRGDLLVVVNAGDTAATTEVGEREVLFETPAGVDVRDGVLSVPGHGGTLLGPVTTFS